VVGNQSLGDGVKAIWSELYRVCETGARSDGDTIPGPQNEKPFYVLSRVGVAKIGLFAYPLSSISFFSFACHI